MNVMNDERRTMPSMTKYRVSNFCHPIVGHFYFDWEGHINCADCNFALDDVEDNK